MNQETATPVSTESKSFKFRFNKDKMGNQRKTVELLLPVLTFAGIIAALEAGGKQAELLAEVCSDTIRKAAAAIVGENEGTTQESFPMDKISWDAIANQSRAERQTISEEVWEAFAKDYIEVMPGVTGKKVEAVSNATIVYLKKFSIVKTDKPTISKLKDQLGLYMENSKNVEQFTEILELLLNKADTYLQANEVALLVSNL